MSTKALPFVVVATLAWGVWGFALKKSVQQMPPLLAYVAFAAMSVVLLPIYALLAKRMNITFTFPMSGTLWAMGAALCVGVGTVALLYAMRSENAGSAVAMTAAYPVVTALLAVAFLGEPVTLSRVAGIGCVALGAVLLSR